MSWIRRKFLIIEDQGPDDGDVDDNENDCVAKDDAEDDDDDDCIDKDNGADDDADDAGYDDYDDGDDADLRKMLG